MLKLSMSSMNKSGLVVRLAVVIIFSSLAIGFISAQLFYRMTYNNELEIANGQIGQLHQTVSATASIAAYLEDNELAREVVNGLASNGIVYGAKIQSEKMSVASEFDDQGSYPESSHETEQDRLLTFPLNSPFEKDKSVGTLAIIPDFHYIQARAAEISSTNVKALIAQATAVALIAIFVAYALITRPMIQIAKALHTTTPGGSERILTPEFHENSELGELVGDVNSLLARAETQISIEITMRKEIEVLEKRFRMLFENSISPIVLLEPRGSILLCNQAFNTLLEKIGLHFRKNFGPLLQELLIEPEKLAKRVQKAFTNQEIATGEYKLNNRLNDDSIWVQVVVTAIMSDDGREYYQMTLHDVSKRKKELDLLSLRADYDQLTQLFNRQAGEKLILDSIAAEKSFVIILLDLDGFKQINDVWGHETGDEILVYVAGQLKRGMRSDDFTCRWGGDEFVLVLHDIEAPGVKVLVDKLHGNISKPYYLGKYNTEVSVGASFGASSHPSDETNMQALIHLADQAMYKVKNQQTEDRLFFAADLQAKGPS